MIGNDIVDLERAEQDSNWRRKGYLQKVFTVDEQKKIENTDTPDVLVWLLWSMKEAAYKAFSRKLGIRNYAPVKINCLLNTPMTRIREQLADGDRITILGQTAYENNILLTHSIIDNRLRFIHTLAAGDNSILGKSVIKICHHSDSSYRLRNPDSVSHHGRYLALAFHPENLSIQTKG